MTTASSDLPIIVLDREKAISFTAIAAEKWCSRRLHGSSGSVVLQALMIAVAWTTRARGHHGLCPLAVHEVVDFFETPLCEWLPGGPNLVLVENGEVTPLCEEMAADAGVDPSMEVEQRVILRAMDYLGVGPDASAKYTVFRRFLVDNASAKSTEAAGVARSVGLDFAEVFQAIPQYAIMTTGRERCFYPCPRCRWPMKVSEGRIRCASSSPCLQSGSSFTLVEGKLLALGKRVAPEPIPVAGWTALRPGLWRFTTLPGLEELDLERRLKKVGRVEVVLWPSVDRYDLDVRRGEHHWRVDMKDYASATHLARRLLEKPVADSIWIVVPDRKREQVPVLRSLVSAELGYRFASCSEFIRLVEGAL